MTGYRVITECSYGYQTVKGHYLSKKKAIQAFNDQVRAEIKPLKGDLVDREVFGEEKEAKFHSKTWGEERARDIVSKKYPVLIYEKDGTMTAELIYWTKTSYEYDEWDTYSQIIRLEQIELIE